MPAPRGMQTSQRVHAFTRRSQAPAGVQVSATSGCMITGTRGPRGSIGPTAISRRYRPSAAGKPRPWCSATPTRTILSILSILSILPLQSLIQNRVAMVGEIRNQQMRGRRYFQRMAVSENLRDAVGKIFGMQVVRRKASTPRARQARRSPQIAPRGREVS